MTAEELEVAIQSRDRPLVIDFFATWCGPCLLLATELEQVILRQWDTPYNDVCDWVRVI